MPIVALVGLAVALMVLAYVVKAETTSNNDGDTSDMIVNSTQNDVRVALRNGAGNYNPDWFDAIGYVESGWNNNATNLTGTDLLRGGAFGAMQMTSKTAIEIGYSPTSLYNADTMAAAAVTYLDRYQPQTFEDCCCYWNTGSTVGHAQYVIDKPNSTYTNNYWGKAMAALTYVQANPPT